MTPARITGRPPRDLEELRLLETGARLRVHGADGTVLSVDRVLGLDFGQPCVYLEVLFDQEDEAERVYATARSIESIEILPDPKIYEPQEAPVTMNREKLVAQVRRTMDAKIAATPELANACPSCGAKPGSWCRRPSGHKAMALHAGRVKLAKSAPPAARDASTGLERGVTSRDLGLDPSPIDRFGDKRPERLDPKDETVVVTLRIPARYVRELDRLAADVETTRSGWARDALLEAIDPHHHLRAYEHVAEEAPA